MKMIGHVIVWLLMILLGVNLACSVGNIQKVTNNIIHPWTFLSIPGGDYEAMYNNSRAVVYFKDDITSGLPVYATTDKVRVAMQPINLQYTNDLDQIQQISAAVYNGPGEFSDDGAVYRNVYGANVDISYTIDDKYVKEMILLKSPMFINPEQYILDGGNVKIKSDYLLDTNAQKILVNNQTWDKKSEKITENDVIISDADGGGEVYIIRRPIAIDYTGKTINGSLGLKVQGGKIYASIYFDYDWLASQERQFPVILDPTIELVPTTEEVIVYDSEDIKVNSTLYMFINQSWHNVDEVWLDNGYKITYGANITNSSGWITSNNHSFMYIFQSDKPQKVEDDVIIIDDGKLYNDISHICQQQTANCQYIVSDDVTVTFNAYYSEQSRSIYIHPEYYTDISGNITYYYPLNETAGTKAPEQVKGLKNGTTSSADYWTTGKIANGYDSNGDQEIALDTVANMGLNGNKVSFTSWVKFNSVSNGQLIFDVGARYNYGITQVGCGTGNINFSAQFVNAAASANLGICSNMTPSTGVWYFVVYTQDHVNDEYKLYVNGELIKEENYADDGSLVTTRLCGIGADAEFNARYLDGVVDEVGVWINYILNSSQVVELYNEGNGLVYPFEKPQSDSIPPLINISINDTAPSYNYHVNVSINTSDNAGLSYFWLYNNMTNTNSTPVALSGTNDQAQNISIITVTAGQAHYIAYVNDTAGNINYTDLYVNITDRTPPSCNVSIVGGYDLLINSSDIVQVILNCTDDSGINTSSMLITRTVEDTLPTDNNNTWSIRVPNNNVSQYYVRYGENILLADARVLGNMWYDQDGIFQDNYTYAVTANSTPTGKNPYVNVTVYNTASVLNYTTYAELAFMPSMLYLSRGVMESEVKKNYSVYKNNGMLLKFWDNRKASGDVNYTTEVYFNIGYASPLGSKNLDFFYCNYSYTPDGTILPQDSPNCAQIGSFTKSNLNIIKYSSRQSSYVSGNFVVTNGKIAGIETTNISYGYFKSDETANFAYYIKYVNGSSGTNVSFSNTQVAWSSTNNGQTKTIFNGTPDIWFSQLRSGMVSYVGFYAKDLNGNAAYNFSYYSDEIGDVDYAITNPTLESYQQGTRNITDNSGKDYDFNGTYARFMTITVQPSIDGDAPGTVNHTIYIVNSSVPHNVVYIVNDSVYSPEDRKFNVYFNTSVLVDGKYMTNVTATANDTGEMRSYRTSSNFTIDNTPPNATIGFNASIIKIFDTVNVSWNISEQAHTIYYYTNMTGLNITTPDNYNISYINVTGKSNISFIVCFNDSVDNRGCTYSSQIVTNTYPQVTAPIINSSPSNQNRTNNTLYCWNTSQSDADYGDTLTIKFLWFNDSLDTGIKTQSLESYYTAKGQNWSCMINVSDGTVDILSNSTNLTILNTPPEQPTLVHPTNGAIITTTIIDLNVTMPMPVDQDNDSITFYYYVNGTLNTTSNINTTYNATINGSFSFIVGAYDGVDFVNSTESIIKVVTSDPSPPNITLWYPSDFAKIMPTPYYYNFTAKDADNQIDAVELWTNQTGEWKINQTNSSTGNFDYYTVYGVLPLGDYLWGVRANDTVGNVAWSQNYTFYVRYEQFQFEIYDYSIEWLKINWS